MTEERFWDLCDEGGSDRHEIAEGRPTSALAAIVARPARMHALKEELRLRAGGQADSIHAKALARIEELEIAVRDYDRTMEAIATLPAHTSYVSKGGQS